MYTCPATLLVEKETEVPAQGFVLDKVIVGTEGKGLTVTVIDFVATQELVNRAVVTRV